MTYIRISQNLDMSGHSALLDAPSRPDVIQPPAEVRWWWRNALALFDALAVLLSCLALSSSQRAGLLPASAPPVGPTILVAVPVFCVCFAAYGLYSRARRRLFHSSFPDLLHLVHALLTGSLLLIVMAHFFYRRAYRAVSLTEIILLATFALVSVPTVRAMGSMVFRQRGLVRPRVLIVGTGVVATNVCTRLATLDSVELVGCVDSQLDGKTLGPAGVPVAGLIDDLPRLCDSLDIDRVIIAFSRTPGDDLVARLREIGPRVRVSIVPRLFDLVTWRSHLEELHGLPMIDVAPASLSSSARLVKRGMDIIVSAVILTVAAPVIVVVAVLIKATSPGPVLFQQERSGRSAKRFKILKFRTMTVGAESLRPGLADFNQAGAPLFKLHRDPRVTRFGQLLRSFSFDELPQLVNVLKGDMSLVGPRPFVVSEAETFIGWAARRNDVRPGMTGLWQVSGRNDLAYEEIRRLDYAYVASWSLLWDMKILWSTPGTVLQRRGAY